MAQLMQGMPLKKELRECVEIIASSGVSEGHPKDGKTNLLITKTLCILVSRITC